MASTTETATNGAQNTTITGDHSSLFVNGILLSPDAPKQERWLAHEQPDVLRQINENHDDEPDCADEPTRAEVIDHTARKLAAAIKENGGTVTMPDSSASPEFVVTQHADDDDHDRFIPDSADPETADKCPQCGSALRSQVLQTRSADEAGTEIYKCSDPTCSHTERRND